MECLPREEAIQGAIVGKSSFGFQKGLFAMRASAPAPPFQISLGAMAKGD